MRIPRLSFRLRPRGGGAAPVRTLVGATLGGIAGLAIGYYAFLYFLGPQGDFLQVADRVPTWLLPPSFAATPNLSRIMDTAEHESQTPAQPAGNDATNLQASYVAESGQENPTVLPEDKTPADDHAAAKLTSAEKNRAETASFEAPSAGPVANDLPRTSDAPPIAGAPSYTAEQLSAALAAARQAQPGLETGDLSDPAVRRTKGLSYAKFCDLAQTATFCDASSGSDVEQIEGDTEASSVHARQLATPATRSPASPTSGSNRPTAGTAACSSPAT